MMYKIKVYQVESSQSSEDGLCYTSTQEQPQSWTIQTLPHVPAFHHHKGDGSGHEAKLQTRLM